jgi:hypothetical protein
MIATTEATSHGPNCLCLSHATAVRAYAAAVEDSARAYASTLPEPCGRAVVVFLRPDGSAIERIDVEPEGFTAADVTSNLAAAAPPL